LPDVMACLIPDIQPFISCLPFSLVIHTAHYKCAAGAREESLKGRVNRNRQKYLWMAGMLLAPAHAYAAETLSPLEVTAGRIAQDPAKVSADVTVIDRKQIIQSQQTTVAGILRSQAGINVARSGGPGKATSIFLRGANSGQTLVLVDGVRVGSATLGSFNWANLITADIQRIEIVRGPQSSLYGADAMGGVIQIFTLKGKGKPKIRDYVSAGTYRTVSGGSSITGATGSGVSYALTADSSRTRSVSAAANGSEPDPYRQTTVSGRLGIPVGAGNLDVIARNVDGKTGLDGYPPPLYVLADVLNYTSSTQQTVTSVKFSYPLGDLLDTSLQISRSGNEVINRDPAVKSNNSDFRTHINQLIWQNHLDWKAISLLAGLNIYKDEGMSGSARLDQSIMHAAEFAALSWAMNRADISASVRHDRNSASGNKTTYHFGGVFRPMGGWRLTANYGTGFKAPSINDLYYPGYGNRNLKPEISRGWDAGIHYEVHGDSVRGDSVRGGFDAVWFDQRFTNLIVATLIAPPYAYAPLNVGQARTKGLELSAHLAWGPAYTKANWTFLHAINALDGTRLARRAKSSGSVIAGVRMAGVNAEVQVNIVGPRFSASGEKKPMQGYHKTDIRLSYKVNDVWTIRARVNNLENKKYEEVAGYGVLGQAFYGSVIAKL